MKITLISAFFDIGRANFTNTEYTRTNEKYFEYFKFWARMKNDLVVYTDSNSSKYVRDIRNSFGLKDKTTIIEINNIYSILPNIYEKMCKVSQNEEFKMFRYYENAMSNRAPYDYVMLLKYWCMNDSVKRGLADDMLAWMDFGFNHGGKCYTNAEEFAFEWNYNFNRKIQLFSLKPVDNISPIMTLQYLSDSIMGSLVIVPKEMCEDLWNSVLAAMEALLKLECIDDDQQLLLMTYKYNPELFELHISDWFMPLKEYGGEHLTIKEKEHVIERKYSIYKKVCNKLKERFIKNPNKIFSERIYRISQRYH